MKKLPLFSLVVMVVGLLLKIIEIPAASLLLLIGILMYNIYGLITAFSKNTSSLEKLRINAWSVFLLGIAFKIQYYPGGVLLLIAGCLMMLIHSLIFLHKNHNTNLAAGFIYLTYTIWTIYLLFRIQFWGVATIIFIVAVMLSIVCILQHMSEKLSFKNPQIKLSIYVLLITIFSFVHSYSIYYFFNTSALQGKLESAVSYRIYDKYSWFLYIANKHDEALISNHHAQEAVSQQLNKYRDSETLKFSKLIPQHEQLIKDNAWTSYP